MSMHSVVERSNETNEFYLCACSTIYVARERLVLHLRITIASQLFVYASNSISIFQFTQSSPPHLPVPSPSDFLFQGAMTRARRAIRQ